MQRLKQHIEKWFDNGATYKNKTYTTFRTFDNDIELYIYPNAQQLSINDLCSPECLFIESLEFIDKPSRRNGIFNLYNDISTRFYNNTNSKIYNISYDCRDIQYHRMQLSLLSDEQKILYILENTK